LLYGVHLLPFRLLPPLNLLPLIFKRFLPFAIFLGRSDAEDHLSFLLREQVEGYTTPRLLLVFVVLGPAASDIAASRLVALGPKKVLIPRHDLVESSAGGVGQIHVEKLAEVGYFVTFLKGALLAIDHTRVVECVAVALPQTAGTLQVALRKSCETPVLIFR
jgi:hypothetical protein